VLGDQFGALVDAVCDLDHGRALGQELWAAARQLDRRTRRNVEQYVDFNLAGSIEGLRSLRLRLNRKALAGRAIRSCDRTDGRSPSGPNW